MPFIQPPRQTEQTQLSAGPIIIFHVDEFSTYASMFSQAGHVDGTDVVNTGALTPKEAYGFGSSLSRTDGIGSSTSSVSQIYDLFENDDLAGFSINTETGGQFLALNALPFNGSVQSIVETTISFEVSVPVFAEIAVEINVNEDDLPGDGEVNVLGSQIQLFEEDALTTGGDNDLLLCEWPGAECEELNLDPGRTYRLEMSSESTGTFDAEFDEASELFLFSTDFDFSLNLEAVADDELECDIPEPLPCFDSGNISGVSVEAIGGVPDYSYEWGFTNGDWEIVGGGDAATVLFEVGSQPEVTLCVTVTDDVGDEVECCVDLELADDGCEGCTPGFWKNHSGEGPQPNMWVGYDPHQLFSSVFDDAFPDMTLLEVLDLDGGGLNALGRHTVAALLNASSSVFYPLTEQQVIDMFNAAFASGDDDEIEDLKDFFEDFNELGCPLSHSADLNEDGFVDIQDLLILMSHWGQSGTSDITGSGTTDVHDLLFLIQNWGPSF